MKRKERSQSLVCEGRFCLSVVCCLLFAVIGRSAAAAQTTSYGIIMSQTRTYDQVDGEGQMASSGLNVCEICVYERMRLRADAVSVRTIYV